MAFAIMAPLPSQWATCKMSALPDAANKKL